jgi:wobble nucleotide-excising tRNase
MLQRVISIANVGRFRNSASTPNPAFGQQTLVFAPNGYGKTTLCAILRSLERGQPEYLLARRTLGAAAPAAVNLLWDGAPRQFQNGNWPGREPRLAIFDGTFVAENVHSGDIVDVANRRNLYRVIVGRDGVDLAAREARLAEDGRATQTQLTPAEKAVTDIAGGVTARAFDALAADPAVEAKLTAERRVLEGLREAAAIRERQPLTVAALPTWPDDFEAVLARTLDGIGAEAEATIARHIEQHGLQEGGQAWLARGTKYADGDDCPFCGRDGLSGLDIVRAYRALFGRAYAELRQAVADLADSIDAGFGTAAVGALQTLDARNAASLEFWRRHCALPELGSLTVGAEGVRTAHRRLRALVDAKAVNLLEPGGAADELESLRAAVAAASDSIAAYNTGVLATNAVIADTKAATAGGDLAAVQSRIADLERIARRHAPDGIARCNAWRALDAEKRRINGEKATVRAALEAHCDRVVQPYETRINHFLGLFNAGFSIARVGHAYPGGKATSSYVLRINDVEVALGDGSTPDGEPSFKNTLSAGDRTTLALAFFLADLERDAAIAARVVVFDDPFNSQDAFRRRQTIYEIMAVARRGAQVIVLSHDPLFLKAIWEKCQPAERVALQLNYHVSVGSKIMGFNLDDACRGRAAAELDALLAFRANGAGDLREIIKKLRVVLETHYRCTFTGYFEPNDNLGEIIRKTREGGVQHPAAAHLNELDRINDYTADYHHGEDARGEPEPFLDREELTGFVNQTIRLANASPA